MNILIACDKFRGSLESSDVNKSLKLGIQQSYPDATINTTPIADGGEGSLNALLNVFDATSRSILVRNAIGKDVRSNVGYNSKSGIAILEMADYVGLAQLPERLRNPKYTSTYGLGQALQHVINLGAKKVILGIGGSATNDAGTGMLQALGFTFYDHDRNVVIPSGGTISMIEQIEPPPQLPTKGIEIIIASDVNNPPTGSDGATMIYAKQKGAKDEDLEGLESGMIHFAQLVERFTGNKVLGRKGFGAAGGVPISACSFLNAELTSGSKLIFDALQMESLIENADLVITGEGKIDEQTNHGKAITPIIECASKMGKKVILVCGVFERSDEHLSSILTYEISKIAKKLGLDSFRDASDLCVEIGKQIGLKLEKKR